MIDCSGLLSVWAWDIDLLMHQSGMSDLVTLVVGSVVSMLMGVLQYIVVVLGLLQYIVVVLGLLQYYCGVLKLHLLTP